MICELAMEISQREADEAAEREKEEEKQTKKLQEDETAEQEKEEEKQAKKPQLSAEELRAARVRRFTPGGARM